MSGAGGGKPSESGSAAGSGTSGAAGTPPAKAFFDSADVTAVAKEKLTPAKPKDAYEARQRVIQIHEAGEKKLESLREHEQDLAVRLKELTQRKGKDPKWFQSPEFLDIAQQRSDADTNVKEQEKQNVRDVLGVLAVENPASFEKHSVGEMPVHK